MGKDFVYWVVGCVEYNYFCFGCDGFFEFVKVDCLFFCWEGFDGVFFWWVYGYVDDFFVGYFNVGDVLVEEGFKDDDFVVGFDEGYEGGEYVFVGVGSDGDFCVGV